MRDAVSLAPVVGERAGCAIVAGLAAFEGEGALKGVRPENGARIDAELTIAAIGCTSTRRSRDCRSTRTAASALPAIS